MIIHPFNSINMWGTGELGHVTISSNTDLTDAEANYASLTINGGNLRCTNDNGCIIRILGDLIIYGSYKIYYENANGVDSWGGSSNGNNGNDGATWSGTSDHVLAAATRGVDPTNNGVDPNTTGFYDHMCTRLFWVDYYRAPKGGDGGDGNGTGTGTSGAGGVGGQGGGRIVIFCGGKITLTGSLVSEGLNGSDATDATATDGAFGGGAGGGGGSGGMIVLVGTGKITGLSLNATGGNGGDGGDGAGSYSSGKCGGSGGGCGGGGAGGCLIGMISSTVSAGVLGGYVVSGFFSTDIGIGQVDNSGAASYILSTSGGGAGGGGGFGTGSGGAGGNGGNALVAAGSCLASNGSSSSNGLTGQYYWLGSKFHPFMVL